MAARTENAPTEAGGRTPPGVHRRTLLAAAAGLAVVPFGSRFAAADIPPKRGGVLKFAVDAEPPNYDCHANVSFATLHPVAPHYSTLLRFDTADYPRIEGDLAQSWTISADQLTYTFRLHPNVFFHDGSQLTSEDVRASYERIVRPPPGVVSVRRVNYVAIGAIDTPDPLTVVFHLNWPEAAMLENFASEWNSIYSAAKLRQDPQFPLTHVLGTGAYTFVEHVKGDHWTGRRFDRYFKPEKPYLDGFRVEFVTGAKMIKSFEDGRIMANFRFISPSERDQLTAARGDQLAFYESPTLLNLLVVFNTKRQPYNDERVRRALSLAIDRWGGAQALSQKTVLKFVGGLLRPGYSMATPEAALDRLPGFWRDVTASRDEAKRLLTEAGVPNLAIKLTNRDLPMPWIPGGDYVTAAWREVGLKVEQQKLNLKDWTQALAAGNFDAAIDFNGDYFDDPTLQLTKYVSRDLSPGNYSSSTDRYLDALYIGQAITPDPRQRALIVREFERQALTQAYTVPLLWYNRIVPTTANVRGWNMTPSQYIGQDLVDVWLDG
ncbi:MAG: ABC transporter substrate-binding protein [Alphaproteobacteria bacterium]|nr:ABC transporter substrate-binding protein [Alphaproteobacteria bacterium]